MTRHPTPNKEGFFWAKMMISDHDDELPAKRWEVVEVVDNNGPAGSLDEFRVAVPGCAKTESRDNFFWGMEVPLPKSMH